MEINKNVQILSIEAKDLIDNSKVITNKTIRKGSLDDSLEVDKLRTLSDKIILFNEERQRYYTDDIVNVTFKYSIKDSEEYDRKVSAINKYYESVLYILNRQYDSGFIKFNTKKEYKGKVKNIEEKRRESLKYTKDQHIFTKNKLRDELYQNGFELIFKSSPTSNRYIRKRYTRYKRTSGSARVGKCLFINEKYYKQMIDWSYAGIEHKIGCEMDCASLEAYISLPTSSAIDRFSLKPENILLVDDYYSEFEDTVMATELINEVYDKDNNVIDGDLHTGIKKTKIRNSLFDGESLLDKAIFEERGYGEKSILQIRNIFFKGIGVNTDIQKFFKDNNITDVSQLNGKTIATDIKQIKLITTPSSVKYMKFGSFEDWLNKIEEKWAICKYEKPQHHFNGMVQTHYQLLNGVGLTKVEMEEFLKDTINYVKLLKNDKDVFKHYLNLKNYDSDSEYGKMKNIDNDNDFILTMLSMNDDFINTDMCKKYRKNMIDSYIANVRRGHVLVEGNYSTLVSCPYEYLLHSIGKFNGESMLKQYECTSYKFPEGEEILAVRSPQPTMSNIVVLKNKRDENIEKYFNTKSKEILYFSPIGWNILELLSSADMDGDQTLITNNSNLVNSAKRLQEEKVIYGKRMSRFLISTDFTPKSNIKRKFTPLGLSDTDIKCSQNKIGEIINLAQILNSLYWEMDHNNATEEELLELYKDISNLNVLSCIEIDRCKKISPVNATKELKNIRDKYNLGKDKILIKKGKDKKETIANVRPMFFKYLDGGKNYSFKYFNTGMDYLNDILNKKLTYIKDKNEKSILIHELFHIDESMLNNKINYKTIGKIANIALKLKHKYVSIFNNKQNYENVYESCCEARNEAIKKINRLELNDVIIYEIVKRISLSYTDKKYKSFRQVGKYIFDLIYNKNKYGFMKNIKVKLNNNIELIEDNNGEIVIYGVNFTKKVAENKKIKTSQR